MANLLGQVTIPASGKVSLAEGLQQPGVATGAGVGGPQIGNLYVQFLTIQNNSAGAIRYGDVTVSPTRGMALSAGTPGGAGTQSTPINYATYLSDWYVAGAAGLVIDFLFIQ